LRGEQGQVTGYLGIHRDITERKRAEQARQQLMEQLVTAQEDERGRLSRELHDTLGQQLTALHLHLKLVQDRDNCPPDVTKEIQQLRELALRIDAEVDRLTFELRPAALDELGLVEALRLLVREWSATSGIVVDLYTRGLDHERISAMLETTVYRIVQEALTNILKHAQATQVSLIVERRGGEVCAVIEDDGQGFDLACAADRAW
jgi:two-component system CheB/CheR fusion protein